MKKCMVTLLAFLLAAGLLFGFAGCSNDDPANDLTTEEASLDFTADQTEPITVDVAASEADITTEAATETTTEAATEGDAPPANLNTLSQAEQLEYFNKAVNRVRTERPGYSRTEQLKIESMNFTGVVRAVQGIINNIASNLMPGDLKSNTMAKGQNNQENWMSEGANASSLRTQDITSINSRKDGDNWVIEVRIRDSVNPNKTDSSIARIAAIQTREEILKAITDEGPIDADPNKATVRYHGGYARVTVNAEGQVIAGANGFDVTAEANDVKITFISTNATFAQTSRWTYSNFNW